MSFIEATAKAIVIGLFIELFSIVIYPRVRGPWKRIPDQWSMKTGTFGLNFFFRPKPDAAPCGLALGYDIDASSTLRSCAFPQMILLKVNG